MSGKPASFDTSIPVYRVRIVLRNVSFTNHDNILFSIIIYFCYRYYYCVGQTIIYGIKLYDTSLEVCHDRQRVAHCHRTAEIYGYLNRMYGYDKRILCVESRIRLTLSQRCTILRLQITDLCVWNWFQSVYHFDLPDSELLNGPSHCRSIL